MITLVGNQLRIENAHFRRTWRITGKGQLLAESFQDRRSGQEWLTPPATLPDDAIAATLAPCPPPSVIEAESQAAELGIAGQAYTLQIFPDVAGVRVTCSAISRSPCSRSNRPSKYRSSAFMASVPPSPP